MRDIDPPRHDPLIGIHAVMRLTSISKATIYCFMKAGRFPGSIELTPGGSRVAWRESAVVAWAADPFGWGEKIDF